MENAVQISENEAIGRLTHLRAMFKYDQKMAEALKVAIDTLTKPTTFLHELGKNDKARRRLEELLNHGQPANDGESLVIGLADAAEVYTILFHAVADPEGSFVELMARASDETTSVITDAEAMQNISLPDEEPEYESVHSPVDIILTSWT